MQQGTSDPRAGKLQSRERLTEILTDLASITTRGRTMHALDPATQKRMLKLKDLFWCILKSDVDFINRALKRQEKEAILRFRACLTALTISEFFIDDLVHLPELPPPKLVIESFMANLPKYNATEVDTLYKRRFERLQELCLSLHRVHRDILRTYVYVRKLVDTFDRVCGTKTGEIYAPDLHEEDFMQASGIDWLWQRLDLLVGWLLVTKYPSGGEVCARCQRARPVRPVRLQPCRHIVCFTCYTRSSIAAFTLTCPIPHCTGQPITKTPHDATPHSSGVTGLPDAIGILEPWVENQECREILSWQAENDEEPQQQQQQQQLQNGGSRPTTPRVPSRGSSKEKVPGARSPAGGNSCHQCHATHAKDALLFCTHKQASNRRACGKKYCFACLERKYRLQAQTMTPEEKATWVCPSSGGYCSCRNCARRRSKGELANASSPTNSETTGSAPIPARVKTDPSQIIPSNSREQLRSSSQPDVREGLWANNFSPEIPGATFNQIGDQANRLNPSSREIHLSASGPPGPSANSRPQGLPPTPKRSAPSSPNVWQDERDSGRIVVRKLNHQDQKRSNGMHEEKFSTGQLSGASSPYASSGPSSPAPDYATMAVGVQQAYYASSSSSSSSSYPSMTQPPRNSRESPLSNMRMGNIQRVGEIPTKEETQAKEDRMLRGGQDYKAGNPGDRSTSSTRSNSITDDHQPMATDTILKGADTETPHDFMPAFGDVLSISGRSFTSQRNSTEMLTQSNRRISSELMNHHADGGLPDVTPIEMSLFPDDFDRMSVQDFNH